MNTTKRAKRKNSGTIWRKSGRLLPDVRKFVNIHVKAGRKEVRWVFPCAANFTCASTKQVSLLDEFSLKFGCCFPIVAKCENDDDVDALVGNLRHLESVRGRGTVPCDNPGWQLVSLVRGRKTEMGWDVLINHECTCEWARGEWGYVLILLKDETDSNQHHMLRWKWSDFVILCSNLFDDMNVRF